MTRKPWTIAVTGAVVAALASCGSASSDVVSAPTSRASSTPTVAAPPSGGAPAAEQHLTVVPAKGLAGRQTVRLVARGFSPGEALVVTQCAAKGTRTGPGDCNLAGMASVTADDRGVVRLDFTVVRGPFGAHKIVCGRARPCLISVTQASLSPTEEADAPISFR